MPTTKRKISEQAQRLYARYVDRENINPTVYKEEMMLLVEQAINEVLEAKIMQERKVNQVNIPQSSLVKYSGIAVSSNQFTLPAFPIPLEKNMGLWDVIDPADPTTDFIPLDLQTYKVFRGTVTETLQNKIGYYQYGDTVTFLSDPGISTVDVYLLVSDLSTLGENDNLPLPASYERTTLIKVMESLGIGAFAQQELQSINHLEDLTNNAAEDAG